LLKEKMSIYTNYEKPGKAGNTLYFVVWRIANIIGFTFDAAKHKNTSGACSHGLP